jgi:hypothetical protein
MHNVLFDRILFDRFQSPSIYMRIKVVNGYTVLCAAYIHTGGPQVMMN